MSGVSKSHLLEGDIIKGLFKLALPLMFLNLVNSLYNIVDTFWIGKMGELQVGAVSLIGPIMGCGSAFVTGLCAAGISLISMALGSRDHERANRLATHLVIVSLVSGVLIGVFCLVFSDFILQWLQTPDDIYLDTKAYLIGISFDFVFAFLINIFHTIRQSDGDTKTSAMINAGAAILNTVLDPIFIFTFHMGVAGAAIATVFSKVLVTPIVLWALFMDKNHVHISFRYKLDVTYLKDIIRVGIPASLASFLSSFGFVLMNKSIVSYGSLAISAYGIGNRVTELFYIPVNAFGGALAPFIGQNLGAKNPRRAEECYRKAMLLTLGISIVVTLLGFITSKYLIIFFVSNASLELMELSLEYCYYVTATIFFMGWFQNLHGVFSGAGNTKVVLYLSIFRLWGLRIPMIYLFAHFTDIGPTGIWWSMVLSNLITCLAGEVMYRRKKWLKAEFMPA